MADVVTIVISSAIGGTVSYVGAVLKNALDLRTTIDKDLRERREPIYKDLWSKTGLLALWPADKVTYKQLSEFSTDLRKWYFQDGGMYMSTATQKRYQELQQAIRSTLEDGHPEDKALAETEYEAVRTACSHLRTGMTKDLLSRRGGGRTWPTPSRHRH